MQCEECDEEAVWMISRTVKIENLKTGEVIVHPINAYEEELMQDLRCKKCAKLEGYEIVDTGSE